MTVLELVAIIEFAIVLISAGIGIGKILERYFNQNKNDRPK